MAELNPVGSELLVNVLTAGDQFDPDVTRLASGGFVVAWASRTTFISARIYGVDGTPTGSEFSVQTNSRSLWEPTLAPTATGGFVNFAWHLTLSTFAIDGVERTATGLPVRDLLGELGSGFTTIPDFPEAASLASGAIVLTYSWGGDVGARFIPLDGSPPGARFIINSTTSGSQRNPEIAGVASGGFVAVWEDNSGAGGDAVGYGIM
ncbi:MAG: hypothetical protein ACXWUX_16395, partial [Allosphingosinicella sp.]